MLSIFNKIEKLSHTYLDDKSKEFADGFFACLNFFLIAIKSEYQYNCALKCRELEKESKDQQEEIRLLKSKIINLETLADSKALLRCKPTKDYVTHKVSTIFGNFSLVVNMDKDTLLLCIMNFTFRYTYADAEEAKSKLIQFINSKNFIGYLAFKDFKTYNKWKLSNKTYRKEG